MALLGTSDFDLVETLKNRLDVRLGRAPQGPVKPETMPHLRSPLSDHENDCSSSLHSETLEIVDVGSVCGFGLVAKRQFKPGELILPPTGRLGACPRNSHLTGG